MSIFVFLKNNKITISSVLIVIGLALIILSTLALVLYTEGDVGILSTVHDFMGNWAYWALIIGIGLTSIGAYYIYSFTKELKEFRRLIKVNSKAKFIKNMDRIEELAWRLGHKYEKTAINKKEEFKIK